MDRINSANTGEDANGHRIRVPANPATGTAGTAISSGYDNDLQEELIGGLIEEAGLTPTAGQQRQILAALRALFAAIGGSLTQGFKAASLYFSPTVGIQPQTNGTALEIQTGTNGALKGNTFQADGRLTLGANATGSMDALPMGQADGRYGKLSNVISGGSINGGTGSTLSTSVSLTPAVDTTLLVVANCGAGSAQTITDVTLTASGGTLANSAINWSNGSTLGCAFGIVKISAGSSCTITTTVTANASTTLSPQLVYLGVPSV